MANQIYIANKSNFVVVFFTIVLIVLSFNLQAQKVSVVDLFQELEHSDTKNKDTFQFYIGKIENHPSFPESNEQEIRLNRWKGDLAFDTKEYQTALEAYSKAVELSLSYDFFGEQTCYSGLLRSKLALDSNFAITKFIHNDLTTHRKNKTKMYAYLCDELATYYKKEKKYKIADSFCTVAVDLTQEHSFSNEQLFNIYTNRFEINFGLSKHPYKSTFYCKENVRLAKEMEDPSKERKAKFQLAMNYEDINENGNAIETYLDIISKYESEKDYFGVARVYSNIGQIQQKENGTEGKREAIKTLKKAISYLHKEDHDKLEGNRNHPIPYIVLSYIYEQLEEYEPALLYIDTASQIAKNEKIPFFIPFTMQKKSLVLSKLKRHKEASQGFLECIKLYKKRGELLNVGRAHKDYGNHLVFIGQVPNAITQFKLGLKLGKGNRKLESECFLGLANANKKAGNYKLESFYNEKYRAINDSIKVKKEMSEIETGQMKYEYLQTVSKREKELLGIRSKKEKAQARIQYIGWGTALLILILGSLVIFLFLRSRDRKKFNRTIEQKNSELTQLNNRLSESNSRLDDFAHVVAHDIRSPLTTIKLYSSILNEESDGTESKNEEFLKYISNGVDELSSMLSSMLEYSKFKNNIALESINLEDLIKGLLQGLQFQLESDEVTVNLRLAITELNSNPQLLKQLLLNIVGNGIKYGDPNKKSIIEITSQEIIEEKKHYCLIAIKDNGIGINEEDQAEIFKPFKTFGKSSVNSYGIGLANCARIAKSLSGSIWVESVLGEGSIFFVKLPLGEIT